MTNGVKWVWMPNISPLQIEYRRAADLESYERKLRKYDRRAVLRMRTSLRTYGFKIPVLIHGKKVVDGHLRIKAAIDEGYDEVPVILCDDWSDLQVKAFRLMANRSASWVEFDLQLVALEIQELHALDFNLDLTGFDGVEIDQLLFGEQAEAEGLSSDLTLEPVTRPGDLWQLDAHRVLCDDSTEAEPVSRLFGSITPVLMVTDPPYGVKLDPTWRERAGLGRQRQTGTIVNDDKVDWARAYKLFPGNVAYVWHAGIHAAEVAAGLESAGFRIRAQIIWAKQQFALSRGDYHWKHEPCWYGVREGQRSNWVGGRKQSTLWEVPNLNPFGGNRGEAATGHGSQKPLELMRRPLFNNTQRGDVVYDPFLGSGSLLIAAAETERVCYGLEIDPRYVDLLVRRHEKFSGSRATLEGDGRTFDEIAAERRLAAVEG